MSRSRSWLATFFVLAASLPFLKKILWRAWYNLLARYDAQAELRFMNYGYADQAASTAVLDEQDEPYRYPTALYRHVLDGMDVNGLQLTEVGSGRGGGAEWIARTLQPEKISGVDLSPEAVASCQQVYNHNNLEFMAAAADALPFADDSIDIVVNVESSHCYPDMQAFLAEVKRILRPGGQMAFCDLRTRNGVKELENSFSQSGLEFDGLKVISPQVIAALDAMHESRELRITEKIPAWLRHAFADFAALQDTVIYDALKSGSMVYVSAQLRKPV